MKGDTAEPNESEKRPVHRRMRRLRRVPCFEQSQALFQCMKENDYDDTKCQKERAALDNCLGSQAEQGQNQRGSSINYHLLRLSKQFKG